MEEQLSDDTDALQAKHAQRSHAKRVTLEMMQAKTRRPKEFSSKLGEEDVTWLFKAIGRLEYDRLLTECPPTPAQKLEGDTYDSDKFAPKLLSKVCMEPELDEEQWAGFWKSPDWSRGEIGELFWTAVNLCGQGLGLTPTEAG